MISHDSNNNRIVQTPHADAAKNEVLVVQEATTKIKEIVVQSVTYGYSKELVQQKLNKTIAKYVSLIPRERQEKVKRCLIQTAQRDYFVLSTNISTINQNVANRISSSTVPVFSVNVFQNSKAILSENKIRGYVTDERKGSAVIKDYQKLVREQVKAISASAPEVQLEDGNNNNKPYKMSARNFAEMSVRYQANLEDVKNLKEKDVKLVWTSSHSDASPRCQPYQGKLYSLDGTSGKTDDGISYTPLDKALLGPKGDGNGIINGYNCRHYLIEYKPGSKAPVHYNKAEVLKDNKINTQQRRYENNIRQLKLQERLAKKSGDKELAKRLNNRWKILELEYQKFSLQNDRAYFPWRCAIMRNEEMNRTKWGDSITMQIKISIDAERKNLFYDALGPIVDTKLSNRIIIDEATQMINCTFKDEEEINLYKNSHKIIFFDKPEEKPDLSTPEGIQYENKRIASVLNLRENLHDENLSKEYCDILGIPNAKIVIVESGYNQKGTYRDGTAVHISKSHSEFGIDKNEINKINELFVRPKELEIYVDNKNKNRYFFITKRDDTHINYLIVDQKDENNFEFFDIYNLRSKSFNQKKKRMTKIL